MASVTQAFQKAFTLGSFTIEEGGWILTSFTKDSEEKPNPALSIQPKSPEARDLYFHPLPAIFDDILSTNIIQ